MGVKGVYISTATPLIGQESPRKMTTPLPHPESAPAGKLVDR